VHEPVQDGAGHGGVAQIFAPVLHHAVGGDDHGSSQLVALVHDGLQQLGTHIGDAPGQEQIVQHQQVGLDPALELLGLFFCAGQPVAGKLGVGLHVTTS